MNYTGQNGLGKGFPFCTFFTAVPVSTELIFAPAAVSGLSFVPRWRRRNEHVRLRDWGTRIRMLGFEPPTSGSRPQLAILRKACYFVIFADKLLSHPRVRPNAG